MLLAGIIALARVRTRPLLLRNETNAAGQLAGTQARSRIPFGPAISAEGELGFLDKIRNRSRVRKGRAKQKIGRATNNRRLQAEGLGDRIGGNVRQFGEELKNAGQRIRRTIER